MRQCLNKLQIVASVSSESNERSSSLDVQKLIPSFAMDINLSQTGFEAAKQMLVGTAKHSFNDRYNMFFNDYELTPLVIQQNYLDSLRSKYQASDEMIDKMAEAADSICDLEFVHERMIRENVYFSSSSISIEMEFTPFCRMYDCACRRKSGWLLCIYKIPPVLREERKNPSNASTVRRASKSYQASHDRLS